MYREEGQTADDVYQNIDVIAGTSGKEITDRNAGIQSSEVTDSDCVRVRRSRAAAVCLLLLCVLLLTALIVLCVTFTRERDRLISTNINLIQLNVQLNQEKNELNKLFQEGWIYYQSSIYYMPNETKSWAESRRDCTERGADLIIINNSDQHDFITKISCGTKVWLGLTDRDVEGRWRWVDGTNMTSGFWRSGEPDGGTGENCAVSHPTGWADYQCTNLFKWICEKKTMI